MEIAYATNRCYGKAPRSEIILKTSKECRPGLDNRCRDLDGEIRHKRGDTLVKTLRRTYGNDFAPGVRGDMRLDTLRDRVSGASLTKIVKG
jgi:hypothetical protein